MALDVRPEAEVSPLSIPGPGWNDLNINFWAKTKADLLAASYYLSGPYVFSQENKNKAPSPTQNDNIVDILEGGKVLEIVHASKKAKDGGKGYGLYLSGPLIIEQKGTLAEAALPVGVKVSEVEVVGNQVHYFDPELSAKGRIAILSITLNKMMAAGETMEKLIKETGLGETALKGLLAGNVMSTPDTIKKATGLARKFLNLG